VTMEMLVEAKAKFLEQSEVNFKEEIFKKGKLLAKENSDPLIPSSHSVSTLNQSAA